MRSFGPHSAYGGRSSLCRLLDTTPNATDVPMASKKRTPQVRRPKKTALPQQHTPRKNLACAYAPSVCHVGASTQQYTLFASIHARASGSAHPFQKQFDVTIIGHL